MYLTIHIAWTARGTTFLHTTDRPTACWILPVFMIHGNGGRCVRFSWIVLSNNSIDMCYGEMRWLNYYLCLCVETKWFLGFNEPSQVSTAMQSREVEWTCYVLHINRRNSKNKDVVVCVSKWITFATIANLKIKSQLRAYGRPFLQHIIVLDAFICIFI